jgi:hypothetical protein
LSFAALRQTVLRAHCLSSDRFAELVQIGSPANPASLQQVKAKIEHEQLGPRSGRRTNGPGNELMGGTLDERERIQVTVSRDAEWTYAYPSRPAPATPLYRGAAIDSDRRPYTFRGEVLFEGDQHAVYIFERARRSVHGKGVV